MIYYIFVISGAVALSSCTAVRSQSSGAQGNYREDLSVYRPKYTVSVDDSTPKSSTSSVKNSVPQKDATRLVNVKLDSLASKNKKMKFAQGFRVLVYAGNSSEEVKKVKIKLRGLLQDDAAYDEYKQPTFRVKIGDCFSRLEAYYVLSKLQKDFPNAIVVPDQINISKEK